MSAIDNKQQYVLDDPVDENYKYSDVNIYIPESHPFSFGNMYHLKQMTSFVYDPH